MKCNQVATREVGRTILSTDPVSLTDHA